MKETSFIEQNREKWTRFEQLYASQSKDPEELSDLYMDITDDLSYAQTFYKRRTVKVYLNQLAQTVYTGVHKQKGESLRKFITVWKISLPLEIYRARKSLMMALISFLIYVLIGVLNTYVNNDFPRMVLGDGYVENAIENISNGNPLAIYQSPGEGAMFYSIALNNIRVAFLTFFLGFFFTVGTHILLFSNGVMLGSFQYFFHTKGLLITSFLGIWIHGAFEISAIVLAGGAGITAGNGWLFPRSYTRLQSLQMSARRGLKIMLSLVPFIIAAGFLESFVTRNYNVLPDWSKWLLILFSFAVILFFYVFYPMYVARKYPELVDQEETDTFQVRHRLDFTKIKTVGNILTDGFYFFRVYFSRIFRVNATITLPLMVLFTILQDTFRAEDLNQGYYWFDWYAQLEIMMGFGFRNPFDFVAATFWTFLFTLMAASAFHALRSYEEPFSYRHFFSYLKKHFLRIWVSLILFIAIIFAVPYGITLVLLLLFPFFWGNVARAGLSEDYRWNFKSFIRPHGSSYGTILLLMLIISAILVIAAQPIAFLLSIHDYGSAPAMNDLLDLLVGFIDRVTKGMYPDSYAMIGNVVRQLVYIFFLLFFIPLIPVLFGVQFYSEQEKEKAVGLWQAFQNFGKRSRTNEKEADYV